MFSKYKNVDELLKSRRPELPVYCVYPHVYRDTAEHFINRFPERVLYAVKANDDHLVIETLNATGVTHFDCASLPDVEFGRMDAYSFSGRTGFNGFFSEDVACIESANSLPPTA